MMLVTKNHYQTLFSFACLLCFLCFCSEFSGAASTSRDSIKHGDFIRDREGEALVSNDFNFVMGFFGFQNSSSRYVGIWYYNIPGPQVIWVANRNKPINGSNGSFTMSTNGNLVILDENETQLWSTNVSIAQNNKNNSEVVLQDDGNLVLSNGKVVLWESFENPSDTYVPGMNVHVNSKSFFLTSWKSSTDPSLGNHTMGIDPAGLPPQIVVWEGEKRKWRSGYWDGRIFTGVDMTASFLHGFVLNWDTNNGDRYFVYNKELLLNDPSYVRFQIGSDGYEREFIWNQNEKNWTEIQKGPHNECEIYNFCGDFAVCDLSVSGLAECSCLKGFERSWSGGCRRTTALKGDMRNDSLGEDGFLKLRCMKLPDFAIVVDTTDCEGDCLKNGSCTAYAEVIGIGCMAWYGELVDLQKFRHGGSTLRIRLARSELGDERKIKKIVIVIISVVLAGLFCLGMFVWLVWRNKRKLKVSTASRRKNRSVIPMFDARKSRDVSAEFSGSGENSLEGNQLSKTELPFYNFSCMSAATNNFSEQNKLGEGGFGPVYKGKLPTGEEIAVKRLSRRSSQGLEEFKNEMMLIAKLQHRNLVRLMGYSIEGEEKLLVYEFMPNKSLDCFLFDPIKQAQLDWARWFEIIEGIARGLLYLHRDSRLRIIHRDLKASNILLDKNMNPKISDFGLARIFGGNQNEANTTRVVGTYGYMSPEYAMEGLFSVKSDVYSFGVLLLEIVSGRKNTSFRHSDDSSLIGYAWHLWNERRALELVDGCIRDSSPENKALRCIHIGMLCVQDSAVLRPNMSNVVLMLESEATTLPLLVPPLVTSMKRSEDREFYMGGLDVSNDLTVTMLVGR
ncbi:G-type lectin S-receptor-like serine/threonine-protein kinase B120 [Vicia villosa]|uniref:G-type lectin S-receptor-like serine/threonine-protein kinase B120 n=1 Tax=Vicia villosa TaxID=3911 RepID=UPI00273ADA8B|nr:G-type lectin S-receptor-like serine/threonine-protein kinase B120 [Vicia villosa]